MFFDVQHPHLAAHKPELLARRVAHFDESNWWQWGRLHHRASGPRIYVNGGKKGYLVGLDPADLIRVLSPRLVDIAVPHNPD